MTTETITLGGGCFWCTESVFVNVLGITDVEFVSAEGLSVSPEQRVTSIADARARIDAELALAA